MINEINLIHRFDEIKTKVLKDRIKYISPLTKEEPLNRWYRQKHDKEDKLTINQLAYNDYHIYSWNSIMR